MPLPTAKHASEALLLIPTAKVTLFHEITKHSGHFNISLTHKKIPTSSQRRDFNNHYYFSLNFGVILSLDKLVADIVQLNKINIFNLMHQLIFYLF